MHIVNFPSKSAPIYLNILVFFNINPILFMNAQFVLIDIELITFLLSFLQSGISILLRKKVPEQSYFKFLKVLKPNVWLAFSGAVAGVAVLLWLLDRFSPFSYQNNKVL